MTHPCSWPPNPTYSPFGGGLLAPRCSVIRTACGPRRSSRIVARREARGARVAVLPPLAPPAPSNGTVAASRYARRNAAAMDEQRGGAERPPVTASGKGCAQIVRRGFGWPSSQSKPPMSLLASLSITIRRERARRSTHDRRTPTAKHSCSCSTPHDERARDRWHWDTPAGGWIKYRAVAPAAGVSLCTSASERFFEDSTLANRPVSTQWGADGPDDRCRHRIGPLRGRRAGGCM